MNRMRWLVLGLLVAFGAGLAATALAEEQGWMTPQGGDLMLVAMGADDSNGAPGMDGDEDGPGRGGPGMGGPHGGPLAGLDLSVDQKAKLKELRRGHREKMQALQNRLQDAREDLHDLLQSAGKGEDFNAKARSQNEKVLDLSKQLGKERFESILEIRAILTPAQLKKFGKFRPGMGRHGMKGRMGRGPSAEARPPMDTES